VKVLIAEDDRNIRRGLADILEAEGYEVVEAEGGEEAIEAFEKEDPDFICLDIMMPKKSGYDVCREIRSAGSTVPIIFISAKSEEIDKVVGLELGADDFIAKPFGVKEVVARIRAVTRRYFSTRKDTDDSIGSKFTIGDLTVFPSELRARRGEVTIELSLREVRLLRLFAENPGIVLSRDRVFDHCWDQKFFPASRTLDQHISKLRKRIELDPKNPVLIKTVHGIGYRYDEF
jgi:DNA-binding response OmpR family regulator